MIPKKIHFCWLSNDPYPPKIQHCIDSWKGKLPDYEIIKWDLNRFPLDKSIWVKEAFEKKKYAFAADYIRFYALYTEGGVYLDSDVEVLKSFNELLDLPYFLGHENVSNKIEAAAMGSEAKANWVQDCLDYYNNKHFIGSLEHEEGKALPEVMQEIFLSKYGITDIGSPAEFSNLNSTIQVLPTSFFSPKSYTTQKINTTDQTFCIHHFAGSWCSRKNLLLHKIEGIFGRKVHILLWLLLRNPLKNIKALLRLLKERKLWW